LPGTESTSTSQSSRPTPADPVSQGGPVVLRAPRATIDLGALAANYRRVLGELNGVPAAGVVKANGYGVGAVEVATTLWAEGCRRFFVARVDEGIQLRAGLAEAGVGSKPDSPHRDGSNPDVEAEINVFDGCPPGTADELVANRLVPILNSLDQVTAWADQARMLDRQLPAGIHIDTGMRRLGLPPDETAHLFANLNLLQPLDMRHVLSHLASADVHGSPHSAQQLEQFTAVLAALGAGRASQGATGAGASPAGAANSASVSLANSAGIFLGSEYHFDLARPGISLYGGSPFPDSGRPNPMSQVLTLEAPIVQIRSAHPGETVGYGGTYEVTSETLVATVPVGYADGFLRSSSSSGIANIGGVAAPIIGRVSMDLITLDVTAVDRARLYPGAPVELIGPNRPIDEVADMARSIPHEFLTNLSRRFELRHVAPR
jgi:alanine racemase